MSAGLPVSANAINKDVGVHTKVCLNVRHRVVSPARIAERTASPEIRLKLYHTSGLRGSHQHLIAEAPAQDAVQTQLQAGAAKPRRRTTKGRAAPSPLAGKLFDETGDRLTPSHTKKKNGQRLRYYVSRMNK